ncbi:hypothetical protein HY626_03745 [Candidatus Uhrbacteria bacterium]|nr:hypothetical protein [Candidatus Uhrbacteria bacterium]
MRDQQQQHPLEGSITETHREHFFTKEDYQRSRELRGEKEVTKFTRLINLMKETLEKIEDPKIRETISDLVNEITRSALRYIDARINLVRVAGQESKDKEAIMSADRSRRTAHIRLVDSIRIACRNLIQQVENFQVPDDIADLVGEFQDTHVKEQVAQAAIDLVWEMLNEEEDATRLINK